MHCLFVYIYIYIINYVQGTPEKTRKMTKENKKPKDKRAPSAGSEIGPQSLIPDKIMAGKASYYHTLHSVLMFQPSSDLSS
jgi:hypothetical protein